MAVLTPLDYSVVSLYLSVIAAVALTAAWKARSARKHQPGSDDAKRFFLAESAAPYWAVAASYFASNIGSDAIIGLSSAGASAGLSAGFFDFSSGLAFIFFAFTFLPLYRRAGVFTLPEFTQLRYGGGCRTYLAVVSLVQYVLAKVAASLFCGQVLLATVTHLPGLWTVAFLLLLAAIFTIIGGLKAVIHIEVVNTGLLIACGAAGLGVALHATGGWGGLQQRLQDAAAAGTVQPETSTAWPAAALHIYQREGAYRFWPLLVGAPWLLLGFHVTDQEMAQRGLSGASHADARLGSVLAGFLKLTVPWTWCLPGIIARALYAAELKCPEAQASGGADLPPHPSPDCTDANLAYPTLIIRAFPPGFRGLMLAACLAGVLSVLASTFNSASTLFSVDVCHRIAPRLSPKQLVIAGRAWILVMTALTLVWLPEMEVLTPTLYQTMQSLNAVASPPIVAVFMLGALLPTITPTAAVASMLVCHIVGFARLILSLALPGDTINASAFLRLFLRSDFLLFACVNGLATVALLIAISACTRQRDYRSIAFTMPQAVRNVRALIVARAVAGSNVWAAVARHMCAWRQTHKYRTSDALPPLSVAEVAPVGAGAPTIPTGAAPAPAAEADTASLLAPHTMRCEGCGTNITLGSDLDALVHLQSGSPAALAAAEATAMLLLTAPAASPAANETARAGVLVDARGLHENGTTIATTSALHAADASVDAGGRLPGLAPPRPAADHAVTGSQGFCAACAASHARRWRMERATAALSVLLVAAVVVNFAVVW